MEMIAMLNGLGAGCRSCGTNSMSIVSGPQLSGPDLRFREPVASLLGRIDDAKSIAELVVIAKDADAVASSLTADEVSILTLALSNKKADIETPFWKRPTYWIAVGAIGFGLWFAFSVSSEQKRMGLRGY